jgi:hypothetical protein
MKAAEFITIFNQLTAKQRQVLQGFLAGKTDEALAALLYVEVATVRRHLANLCKAFGLSNAKGEHYSYRPDLIALCLEHRPDWVSPALVDQPLPPEPGRCLGLNSAFYLKRPPIESRAVQEIQKPGALVRIRAARQRGKTSLMQRLLAEAERLGQRAVYLNLRQAETKDLDQFLQWFCANISQRLGLPLQLEDYWDRSRFGSITSCTIYMQAAILPHCNHSGNHSGNRSGNRSDNGSGNGSASGLVLGLDDIDYLFEMPQLAQGFFALLRGWHEEANNLEIWQSLRLVVAHATEVYIPLKLNQSPFNVGLPIRLPDLTVAQIEQLAQRYRLNWSPQAANQLFALVGGHPYLVQLALYHLHEHHLHELSGSTLSELLDNAPTQAGIYASHLRYHWQVLQAHPELLYAFQSLLDGPACLEPLTAYKLESGGLIWLQGNFASVSCELYRQFFQNLI